MTEPSSSEAPPVAPNPWARTVMWLGVLVIFGGGAIFVFKSCMETPGRVIQQTGQALATVAAAFNRGVVSNSFTSYATTMSNTLYLQVASLKQMEAFTRQEVPMTGFGYIPLPDVVVEARAPVEYTYYVDLNEPWRFVLEAGQVHVYAPPIRYNKPAVDVSAISYEVRRGFLKTDEALANLKRSITSLSVLRARDNVHLVRETSRRQVTQFVEGWLVRSFADGEAHVVVVHFADEHPEGTAGERWRLE